MMWYHTCGASGCCQAAIRKDGEYCVLGVLRVLCVDLLAQRRACPSQPAPPCLAHAAASVYADPASGSHAATAPTHRPLVPSAGVIRAPHGRRLWTHRS